MLGNYQPAAAVRRNRPRGGFTLIEMLTTVAMLIIVLGLMVSLARYVRRRSAEDLTRKLLANLSAAMLEYTGQYGKPAIESFASGKGALDEPTLQRTALAHNRKLVQLFRSQIDLSAKAFRDLPLSIYDETTIRDAWGTPVIFMPGMHRQIGMASNDDWFFFSAGPDRQYLTREDNQYSYDAATPAGP